jgi:1-acyl-sn-glycerol-3-phosphate acyltransferase
MPQNWKVAKKMSGEKTSLPKPISRDTRVDITHLPELNFWRRCARRVLHSAARLLVWLFTKVEIQGIENFPQHGPAIIVSNHLGDADMVLGIAFSPQPPDVLAKAELYDLPVLGKLMDLYGVIWVHRGQPDRRALRAGLRGLAEGRLISLAPEGRESLTGALEEGTNGAAYLALKADAPILPVTFTNTENQILYLNIKHLRRTQIKIKVGNLFRLERLENRRLAIHRGTEKIMETLADQLPLEYRGVYQINVEPDE